MHQLEQQGHRFFPLELASLVHTESTRIATNTFTHAIKAGLDVIIDSFGANEKSIHSRLIALQEAGYTVELIDVECPHKVSEKAIFQQWSQGRKKSLQSPDAPLDLGEHWVPSVTLDPLFPSKGPSVPEAVTKCLAAEFTNIIAYQLWRRTSAAQAPSLEADLIQIVNGSTLANRAETQTSRTIFKARPHRHTKGTAVG
ncbi:zeta toxin family protein [Dermabacter hominis]|uniref:zeta toxin family protein n=1 Tax=Dermabacter hominis TaxID=36740 RepID=UPI003CCB9058